MSGIFIKEVQHRKDVKAFVKFPFRLYKSNEYWVPPIIADELGDFNPKKNPAFEYAKLRQWLAFRNDEVVGRIAGVLHSAEFEESKKIRFGWIDFIDDREVSKALLEQVENWGKELGAKSIHGPMGFNDFDFEGMLVEGFDSMATIATIYNYPYYKTHIERLGYEKAVDWLEFIKEVPPVVDEKFSRVSSLIKNRYKYKPIEITIKKQILTYSDAFFEVVNKSYAELYGFHPLTNREAERIKKNYFSFLSPKFIKGIADKNDKLIAFGITMPSLSKAYQKANGRLFPFGFIHLLKALKFNKVIDMYLIGSLPEKQNSGAVSMVYHELWKTYIKEDVTHLRSNPILETNHKLLNIWKSIYGKDFLEKAQLKGAEAIQNNYCTMNETLDINHILKSIPHSYPFRFIDGLDSVTEDVSIGHYYFKKDEYFYKGHYPNLPVTPSVILIETMAQIGLIPLGIANYQIENSVDQLLGTKPIFTNSDVKFISPVFPETKVIVEAKKVYFRMNRLKARVKLFNDDRVLCASGVLSGIILSNTDLIH